jgi:hypothetical protein
MGGETQDRSRAYQNFRIQRLLFRVASGVMSQLSHAVVDSGLERKICAVLDADDANVEAWVKNHRLYLEIPYLYFGNTYRYRPDFAVRLTSGLMILLEGKGDPNERDDAKATAARRWVQAVNTWGGLGAWTHHICYDAANLKGELLQLMREAAGTGSLRTG